MTKAELRRWTKEQRARLPTAQLSQGVSQHLALFLHQHQVQHILLYSAFGSELDPSGVQALYPAQYYLPRIAGTALTVHPLPCELVAHRYGFAEPAPAAPQAAPSILQAVLVPGLAFDHSGHRLGYGQGFYDRFLSQLSASVLTIGIACEALLMDRVPFDHWDIAVKFLATEKRVFAP
jgi:5-formyltetrahydrofolate cyclo-ligase